MIMKEISEGIFIPSIEFTEDGFPVCKEESSLRNERRVNERSVNLLNIDFPILAYKLRCEILEICKGLETPYYQNLKSGYKECITQYIMSNAKLPSFRIMDNGDIVQAKNISGVLAPDIPKNEFFGMSTTVPVSPFSISTGAKDICPDGVHILAKEIDKGVFAPFVAIYDDGSRPALTLVTAHTDSPLLDTALELGCHEVIVAPKVAMTEQSGLDSLSLFCLQKVIRQIPNIREATNNEEFDFSKLLKLVLSYLDGPCNIGYVFSKTQIK